MSDKYELITAPNKILQKKCDILYPDEEHPGLIQAMTDTMLTKGGIGLAANQVGVSKQLFIVRKTNLTVKVVINPTIIKRSNDMVICDEGCLSFPGKTFKVRRAKWVEVAYYNAMWEETTEMLEDLDAVVFQHEFDHTRGKTAASKDIRGIK